MTSIAAPPQLPFSLGAPSTFRGLTVIPLFPLGEPTLEYVGLDEAVAYGLEITEFDHAGSVNDLLVWNPLDLGALIFEGEELVGAKQNRILDRTVFVKAKSRTKLSVNCVERGRWSYRSERFTPAPRAAHPTARYSARVGGQGAVWSEIAAKSTRLEAHSETEAAEAMYVKSASSLDDYLTALPRRPGQSGTIVCLAGRVTCLDYVSRCSKSSTSGMTNVIRSVAVPDKAISVRLDGEAQRALDWIMSHGYSQSEAIREALIRAARVREREQVEADAKRIANDPADRAEIEEIREFFGELELPPE